jgi:acid phosphatase (class A)
MTFAQSPAPNGPPAKKLQILSLDQIDPGRLLPPPAPDGSPVQQRELADVKQLIATRAPERHAQAVWDAQHEDPLFLNATLGPIFDLKKLPATARLLSAIVNDQSIASSKAKEYFHRKVPMTAAMPSNYREWTCDQEDRKPETRGPRSYPSAHATLAYSVGGVLAELIPERAQAVLARAADFAYSREVCGDHYHSDIEASHALGAALAQMFLTSSVLKPQLEAARSELHAAFLGEATK